MNRAPYFVHLIESPGALDLLDGRTEGRLLTEALQLGRVPCSYNLTTSREMLALSLGDRLQQAIETFKLFPIVHFSLHGNQNGIGLTSGEVLTWDALRDLLEPINTRLGGSLIVSMSSCFGAWGSRMAMHEGKPLPFFALVGHNDKGAWNDLAIGFASFYHHIGKGTHVNDAVAAMKAASGDDRFMCVVGHEVQQNWTKYVQEDRLKKLLQKYMDAHSSNALQIPDIAPAGVMPNPPLS